jgi:serine/threonine protein kinase
MRVTQDPHLGTVLQDKYRVISEIGRGGMSIVYKARHEMMDKQVAIKMLQQGLMGDQTSIKRFQQEAQAASCLAHQNVITIFDFGVSPTGQPYLVMDFLEGHSLADVIKAENHISQRRAAAIFIQACDALEHAHQKGVLHRDLKSSNIMLVDYDSNPDFVKVVDFGIAKLMPNSGKQQQNLTATGEIFGSPIYMSPEQCLGLTLDARSDIYSMGTMLYEALTGQPPLLGANIIDTMQMHVESVPARPSKIRSDLQISGPLEMICVRSLEKKPENRFKSMGEFRDALLAIVPLLPAEAGQPANRQFKTGTRQNMPGVLRQNATGAQTGTGAAMTGGGAMTGAPGSMTGVPGSRDFPGGPNSPKGIAGSATSPGFDPRSAQSPQSPQSPKQDQRPDRFAPPGAPQPPAPPFQSPPFQQGQNPNYSTGQVPNISGQNFQQPQQRPPQQPFQSPQQPNQQQPNQQQLNQQQPQPQYPQQQPSQPQFSQQPQYPGSQSQSQDPQHPQPYSQQNQQQFTQHETGQSSFTPQNQQPGTQQFATGANLQTPQHSQSQTGHQGQPNNIMNPGNAGNSKGTDYSNQSGRASWRQTGDSGQSSNSAPSAPSAPPTPPSPSGWPVLQPESSAGGSSAPQYNGGQQGPQGMTGAQQGLGQMAGPTSQQFATDAQNNFSQQSMTGQSQYVQQSTSGAQTQHLMASNRPEILTTGSYPATQGPEIAVDDDSLFGNPSLYGEKTSDETLQFQTQYERNKAANKPASPNSSRNAPDHLPSKRINSDYSDLLDEGNKKSKKGGVQAPKRTIYAPELPANKTGLIVMIVLGTIAVILIIVALCYVLFTAVKPPT